MKRFISAACTALLLAVATVTYTPPTQAQAVEATPDLLVAPTDTASAPTSLIGGSGWDNDDYPRPPRPPHAPGPWYGGTPWWL